MENSEKPAFVVENNTEIYPGLSKREYFAAMAMQGFISNANDGAPRGFADVCERSLMFADELLKQLEGNGK